MESLISYDSQFQHLVEVHQNPLEGTNELVQAIQCFRSNISLRWMEHFAPEEKEQVLSVVWDLMFELSASEEPTVYVAAYTTLGAMIFTLSPFFPHQLMRSFAESAQKITVTSNASIAIISTFLYILNIISPADVEEFVTNTPVIMHFGVDVSNFIQHIPRLIHLMEPLEAQFHSQLLRSLVVTQGRTPNHNFVDAVSELVKLNPEILVEVLMEHLISNNLSPSLLALGPKLLQDEKTFKLCKPEYIQLYFDTSINVIKNPKAILKEFEEACGTLANILQHSEDKDKLQQIISENTNQEYPRHLRRFLISLENDLSKLFFADDDTKTIKVTKIKALSNFLQKNPTKEAIGQILSLFESLIGNVEENIMTSIITCLSECYKIFVNENREKFAIFVKRVLEMENMTWIQCCELVQLINTIGLNEGCKMIPNFQETVIALILEWAMSPQNELYRRALKTIQRFVSYGNLKLFFPFLFSINYFEESSATRFVLILDALYDGLPTKELVVFAPLVCEIIMLHQSPIISGSGFNFLQRLNFDDINMDIADTCIDWIIRLYRSFTLKDSLVNSRFQNEPLPFVTSMIETDIVASPILESRIVYNPLRYCLEYFLSIFSVLDQRSIQFVHEFVCLFPDVIIPIAAVIFQNTGTGFDQFSKIVADILNSTNSPKTAAICAEFLCFAKMEYRLETSDTLRFLLRSPKVKDGTHVFSLYRLLHFSNHNDAVPILEEVIKRLDEVEKATIEAKLCLNEPQKFDVFAENTSFQRWPIIDTDFLTIFSINKRVTKIENFEELDDDHWRFILKNKDRFELINFDEYKKRDSFRVERFIIPEETKPVIQPIDPNTTTEVTILPYLLRGEFMNCPILIKNFINFSEIKLSEEKRQIFTKNINETENQELIELVKKLDTTVVDKTEEFQKLVHDFELKSKTLIKVIEFIQKSKTSPESLVTFVSKNANQLTDAKTKRILYFLRATRYILGLLHTCSDLLTPFGCSLFFKLAMLYDSPIASIHVELARIMLILFQISNPTDYIISKIINMSQNRILNPYLPCLALINSPDITKKTANALMNPEIPIPTLKMLGFRIIQLALKRNWAFFAANSDLYFDTALPLFSQPIFSKKILDINMIIIRHPEFRKKTQYFLPKLSYFAFCIPPSHPSSVFCFPLITPILLFIENPWPSFKTFTLSLLETKPHIEIASTYYVEYVKWKLRFETDEFEQILLVKECVRTTEQRFRENPTYKNMDAMIQAWFLPLTELETAFTYIWKLMMYQFPTLMLCVLLKKFMNKCSYEQIERWKEVFGTVQSDLGDIPQKEAFVKVLHGERIEKICFK